MAGIKAMSIKMMPKAEEFFDIWEIISQLAKLLPLFRKNIYKLQGKGK